MQPRVRSRQPRRPIRLALAALAVVLVLPAPAGAARTAATKRVVKLEESASGGSVLANLKGRTLYSLSVERHGKFICTAGCLSVWHPLVIPKGVKPTGPVKLGTVKRPDGRIQVTYRGGPLYSFAEDTKTGETNGEGIKDVGTWHAVMPATPQPESSPASPSPEPPYQYPPY